MFKINWYLKFEKHCMFTIENHMVNCIRNVFQNVQYPKRYNQQIEKKNENFDECFLYNVQFF